MVRVRELKVRARLWLDNAGIGSQGKWKSCEQSHAVYLTAISYLVSQP